MSRSPRLQSRRGFTLIEMLIVVVVLSIVATITLPRIDFVGHRADAGARVLRTGLSYAARQAVLKQHDIIVGFDAPNARLVVHEDGNNNGTVDAGERITMRPIEEGIGFGIPKQGVTGSTPLSAVSGPGLKTLNGLPSVTFRRNGAASTDLEIYLTSQRTRPTDFRAVTVTKATARVDGFRYTPVGWQQGGV